MSAATVEGFPASTTTVPVQFAYPANSILTAYCPGWSFVTNGVRLNGAPAKETAAPAGLEVNVTSTNALLDGGETNSGAGAPSEGAIGWAMDGCCMTPALNLSRSSFISP